MSRFVLKAPQALDEATIDRIRALPGVDVIDRAGPSALLVESADEELILPPEAASWTVARETHYDLPMLKRFTPLS